MTSETGLGTTRVRSAYDYQEFAALADSAHGPSAIDRARQEQVSKGWLAADVLQMAGDIPALPMCALDRIENRGTPQGWVWFCRCGKGHSCLSAEDAFRNYTAHREQHRAWHAHALVLTERLPWALVNVGSEALVEGVVLSRHASLAEATRQCKRLIAEAEASAPDHLKGAWEHVRVLQVAGTIGTRVPLVPLEPASK